jgi:hypothetical protein
MDVVSEGDPINERRDIQKSVSGTSRITMKILRYHSGLFGYAYQTSCTKFIAVVLVKLLATLLCVAVSNCTSIDKYS